jgi:hypothetical protein
MAEAQPGLSAAAVAREVASSRQAANEMLGSFELDGLIERRPNPTDRCSHQIHVTESGRARLAEARIAVDRREAELEAAFTPAARWPPCVVSLSAWGVSGPGSLPWISPSAVRALLRMCGGWQAYAVPSSPRSCTRRL